MYHRLDYFIASIYKTRHLLQNVNVLIWSHSWVTNLTGLCHPSPHHPVWYLINTYIFWITAFTLLETNHHYYWPFYHTPTKLREGTIFIGVCHSVHGEGLPSHNAMGQADHPFPPLGILPISKHAPPPPNRIKRDTVNKRAVRIQLECILVQVRFLPAAMAWCDQSWSEPLLLLHLLSQMVLHIKKET